MGVYEERENHDPWILACNVVINGLPDAVLLQGYVPMFVNATGGSTVYGAFDPINEIADICEKYNMWLHVDVRKHTALTPIP